MTTTTWKRLQHALHRAFHEIHDEDDRRQQRYAEEFENENWESEEDDSADEFQSSDSWKDQESEQEDGDDGWDEDDDLPQEDETFPSMMEYVVGQEKKCEAIINRHIESLATTGRLNIKSNHNNEEEEDIAPEPFLQIMNYASGQADMIYELEAIVGPPNCDFSTAIRHMMVTLWEKAGRRNHVISWSRDQITTPQYPEEKPATNESGLSWADIVQYLFPVENEIDYQDDLYNTMDCPDIDTDTTIHEYLQLWTESDEQKLGEGKIPRNTSLWFQTIGNPGPERNKHIQAILDCLIHGIQNKEDPTVFHDRWLPLLNRLDDVSTEHLQMRISTAIVFAETMTHLQAILEPEHRMPPIDVMKTLLVDYWQKWEKPRMMEYYKEIFNP